MIDKIEIYCETCNKKLESMEEHKECFDKNHTIHSKGMFVVKSLEEIKVGPNVKIGRALTNAKAGEEVIARLK